MSFDIITNLSFAAVVQDCQKQEKAGHQEEQQDGGLVRNVGEQVSTPTAGNVPTYKEQVGATGYS